MNNLEQENVSYMNTGLSAVSMSGQSFSALPPLD